MDSALTEAVDTLTQAPTGFGLLDYLILAYLAYGAIRGAFRGLSSELASLIGTILVFWGGWHFYDPVSRWLVEATGMEDKVMSQAISYIGTVVLLLVAWNLLFLLIRKLLDLGFPDQIEHVGGFVAGAAKGGMVVCVVFMAVQLAAPDRLRERVFEETWCGRLVHPHLPERLPDWVPTLLEREPALPDVEESGHGAGSGDA